MFELFQMAGTPGFGCSKPFYYPCILKNKKIQFPDGERKQVKLVKTILE